MADILITGAIGRDHYRVTLRTHNHTIIADEPTESGGGDEGMNPHEILASSLGACTCATLRMYADRKAWPLDGIQVIITLARDIEQNATNIHRDITLLGDLTDEQRTRLMEIADKCPVHKTLTNPINIDTSLLK
jgi:putative redox protein